MHNITIATAQAIMRAGVPVATTVITTMVPMVSVTVISR